jgi:hypothetical protein
LSSAKNIDPIPPWPIISRMIYLSRRTCPESIFVDKEGPRIKYIVRSKTFQYDALGVTQLLDLG